MDWSQGYEGRYGIEAKAGFLREYGKICVERCPRTLLIAATVQDPATELTQQWPVRGPQGVRLINRDLDMHWSDLALLLGFTLAQVDLLVEHFSKDLPPKFKQAVEHARSIYVNAPGIKVSQREWTPPDDTDFLDDNEHAGSA